MGSLSNLYISQSYQSLIHLGTNSTASATLIGLEDGLGNSIGISVNTAGDLKVDGILSASVITQLSQSIININTKTGSFATTGSNTFIGNQTITGDVQVSGILSATEIHTLIESSSIIFSSGSNIFGDALNDTQTLNGTVIISGSQNVSGSVYVTGEVSSSTIAGMGNVAAFSQSVDSRLDNLEGTFSTSVDNRLDNLESYTASNDTKWTTLQSVTSSINSFTASTAISITNLNASSASQQVSINAINTYTASVSTSISNLNASTASQQVSIDSLNNKTGSFVTTGSNTFSGSQTITGSVYGNVTALSITSNTASINMSAGNIFTLTLSTSSTHLDATNIGSGQTVNLLITNASTGTGTLTLAPKFKQPAGFTYVASPSASAQDILTFVTFGSTTSIYTLNGKQFV